MKKVTSIVLNPYVNDSRVIKETQTFFPLWKKIIEDSGCGICVNPTKSDEVRRACLKLVNNRELGKKMGLAGRKYVVEKYNWAVEEKKLVNLYQSLQ